LLEARPLRPADTVRTQRRFAPVSSDERQAERIVHPEMGDESAGATARSRSRAGSPKERRLVSRVGLIGFCSLAVAAIAAAARLPGFLRDALWQDEVAAARVISEPSLVGMLRHVAGVEATPPFWYALGWLAHTFGLSPESFRIVSVLSGALLAGLVVILARRALPLWASVVAGLLVAFGWQFVMHGHELRAYELFALATVVLALLLLKQLSAPAGRGRDLALVVCVALGSLTNYFFLLTLGAVLLWIWTEPALRATRRRLTCLVAIGLVPLALWSPVLVHQYLAQRFAWIGPFNLRRMLDAFWLLFAEHLPTTAGVRDLVPPLALVAVIAGSIVLFRSSPAGRLVALLALVPFAVESLAWMAGARVFDPRNLIGAAPFAAVALAALAARLPRRLGYVAAAAVVSAVAVGSIQAEATPTTPYDRIASQLVAEGWTPSDPVVVFGNFFSFRDPLEWYLPGQPALTLAEPTGKSGCRAVFVVAQRPGNQRALLAAESPSAKRSVGSILVARLPLDRIPVAGFWRRAHVLAAKSLRPACAGLVDEAQIVSRLRR
jgi:hypothetical protein